MSFDYIDDIKQSEQPSSSLGKKDSWVKNSTNIHVPQQSTYMQAFRKAQSTFGIPKNHNPKD
jgi:hypothetical protein